VKRIFKGLLFAIIVLLIVLFAKTIFVRSRQISVVPVEKIPLDSQALVKHFSDALQIRTISYDDPSKLDASEFRRFHDYLKQIFPLVHSHLETETVKGFSLLYQWKGKDPSLAPVVLMAHMDVVPVESTPWKHPAFGGEVVDGYIWGRGTLDDKSNVISQLESVEYLLQNGFQPRRTIYFAYGHDEESGGSGAAAIVQVLRARGIKPEMVIDEGGAVLDHIIPGVLRPTAMVGTSEKGYVSVDLIAEDTGGHSSAPPAHTLIGVMSQAVKRLEDHQMPGKIGGIRGSNDRLPRSRNAAGWKILCSQSLVFSAAVGLCNEQRQVFQCDGAHHHSSHRG
jgi:carboxypeptidase PM20D1